MTHTSLETISLETTMADERARLVRLCAHLTGDASVAEDLAQEALVEAWRNRHKIYDPSGEARWLAAIARMVCLRWARRRGRDLAHGLPLPDDDITLADAGDELEIGLERRELAELLDRALALLPPDTRDLLVARYVEESPLAEISARLGVSADATTMRISRGKLALRRLFATALRDDAAAFGLFDNDGPHWQETRIRCPQCGGGHLLGSFDREINRLLLRCPHCAPPDWLMFDSNLPELAEVKGYKPAFTRILRWVHNYYHGRAENGTLPCLSCGERLPIRFGSPPHLPDSSGVYVWCERCKTGPGNESWFSLTGGIPAVQRFWRTHPHIRAIPEQSITFSGQDALLTGFETRDGASRIEAVHLRATFALVDVSEKR